MAGACPREQVEGTECANLSQFAAKSSNPTLISRIHFYRKDPFRTEFQRDYTRILHSRAFRRLRQKTQVFISPKNDHLCTRLEHSLHVASVACTIAQALRLNTDLVEAIAMGHDLGHAPFGHKGEACLSRLAKKHGLGQFRHEFQSLRVVDNLERMYPKHIGLNLTFAVRDGIACHYGEGFERCLKPERRKKPQRLAGIKRRQRPATLEGCVVRLADKVAYLGRDLEDAKEVGIVKPGDLPKTVTNTLGKNNKQIISRLVADIVAKSRGKDQIAVGARVCNALVTLYNFSRKAIYQHPTVAGRFSQVDAAMRFVFEQLLILVRSAKGSKKAWKGLEHREEECIKVLVAFLGKDLRDWRELRPARLVIDFIAGMTDSFLIESFKELGLPSPLV